MKKLLAFLLFFCMTTSLSALPTQQCTELTWDAVTTYVDGSALTNLAGYKIYFRNVNDAFIDAQSYQLADPTDTNILFTEMSVDPNEFIIFAVTAYDDDGNEGDFSNEVSINKILGGSGGLNCR